MDETKRLIEGIYISVAGLYFVKYVSKYVELVKDRQRLRWTTPLYITLTRVMKPYLEKRSSTVELYCPLVSKGNMWFFYCSKLARFDRLTFCNYCFSVVEWK